MYGAQDQQMYYNNYNSNQYALGYPYSQGLGGMQMANNQSNISQQGIVNTNPYAAGGQQGMNPGQSPAQELINSNNSGDSLGGLNGEAAPSKLNASNVGGAVSAGIGVAGFGMDIYNDASSLQKTDPNKLAIHDNYNPYMNPGSFQQQQTPYDLSKAKSANNTWNYVGKGAGLGAQIGTMIEPGIGTAIGAGVGALAGGAAGLITGAERGEKRKEFEAIQQQRQKSYVGAQNRYYDILSTQNQMAAQNKSLGMRGQNNIPIYNASIYGYM